MADEARRRMGILVHHVAAVADADTAGPLSGFRVLDMTQMVSGPMAACYLADQVHISLVLAAD